MSEENDLVLNFRLGAKMARKQNDASWSVVADFFDRGADELERLRKSDELLRECGQFFESMVKVANPIFDNDVVDKTLKHLEKA
jgi:hypothetical protein